MGTFDLFFPIKTLSRTFFFVFCPNNLSKDNCINIDACLCKFTFEHFQFTV